MFKKLQLYPDVIIFEKIDYLNNREFTKYRAHSVTAVLA